MALFRELIFESVLNRSNRTEREHPRVARVFSSSVTCQDSFRSMAEDIVAWHNDSLVFGGHLVLASLEAIVTELPVEAVQPPGITVPEKPVDPVGVVPPLVGSVPETPAAIMVLPVVPPLRPTRLRPC